MPFTIVVDLEKTKVICIAILDSTGQEVPLLQVENEEDNTVTEEKITF